MIDHFKAEVRDNIGAVWKIALRPHGPAVLARDGELAAEVPWGAVYAAIADADSPEAAARWVVASLARRAQGLLPRQLVAPLEAEAARWLRMNADRLVPAFARGRFEPANESLLVAAPVPRQAA